MEFWNKLKAKVAPKLQWLKESWLEVRHKVTWPTKEEVRGTTGVVVVTVLVFAAVVGAMDYLMYLVVDRVFAALS